MNEQKDAILQAISSGEEATGVMAFPIQDGEWLRDDLQFHPILGPWYTNVIWQGKVMFWILIQTTHFVSRFLNQSTSYRKFFGLHS